MRIALIGQSDFGKDVLDALIKDQKNIVGVFCPPDSKEGQFDPIKESAQSHKIDLYQFGRLRDPDPITTFLSLNVDLCVMAFVTDIVPMEIINSPNLGTIQYHPSLLPLHRGPSSMNWPIIAGKKETGLSIFWPDDGLDTGPILASKELDLDQNTTHGDIEKKLSKIGAKLLIENLKNIQDVNSKFINQKHLEATYAKKINKNETKINWKLDANKVLAHIHGLSPNPGAWFEYEKERFKVLRAKVSATKGKPGVVLDNNLTIGCKSSSIQILELQRQGKNKQTSEEFLLGKTINKGSILS